MTRHRDLLESPLLADRLAIFTDAERVIADPVVRNRGTIGGALCQADPSEDLSAVCAAVGAEMVIRGAGRRARRRHATSSTAARTRRRSARRRCSSRSASRCASSSGSAYEKVDRRVGDWAVVAAGASRARSTTARSPAAGIALAAVGGEITSTAAETALTGRPPSERAVRPAPARSPPQACDAGHRPARLGGVQAARRRRPDRARAAARDRAGAHRDETEEV